MAIDTDNEKLSLISYNQPFNPAIPISSDGLGQADNQHLIWQYAGVLWSESAAGGARLNKLITWYLLEEARTWL